jgi:diguanylate cyclase (GGDEF)-like protein
MRRSDQPVPLDRRRSGNPFVGSCPLPEPVYREFIDMLFSMRLPIVGLGIVFVAVAGLGAYQAADLGLAALAAVAALVTLVRFVTLTAYARRQTAEVAQLQRWERRYAIGSYAFALLLALLNIRALAFDQPLLHLITVSLVFSFGAGIVSRISVRPIICVVSLLFATVPTVAALVVHAFVRDTATVHTGLYAIQAVLVAMITALSLQTVSHLYRSARQHHTAKHDLAELATHDALTGLANRLLLRERFEAGSLAAKRLRSKFAVHCIDLDGFKAINDVHGHPAGDSVLEQVARRLEATVRAADTVARLGGDEFVVLQTNVEHASEADLLARRIIKRLSEPYEVEGVSMRISASVGIAMVPDWGFDLGGLLSGADAALYESKRAGKARVCFCEQLPSLDAKAAA